MCEEHIIAAYQLWTRILVPVAYAVTRDWQAAEDAAQEGIIALFTSVSAGRIISNPKAWLVSTVRRKAIDFVRSRTARQRYETKPIHLVDVDNPDDEMLWDKFAKTPSAEDTLITRMAAAMLMETIARTATPAQSGLLELMADGYLQREIAAMRKVDENVIQLRIHRLRKNVEIALDPSKAPKKIAKPHIMPWRITRSDWYEAAFAMHQKGATLATIADHFGKTTRSVATALKFCRAHAPAG